MKKGFTLVEIMAVIIILGVIGLIAVIAVDKSIKDNNQKLYEMQISNIEDAVRTWGATNLKYLPNSADEALSIPLLLLKKEGLLDKNIKNPKTDTLFPNDMFIDITYKNGVYNYTALEDSGTDITNDLDVPVIVLQDTFYKEISINGTFDLKGFAILRDGTTIDLNSGSSYITIDNHVNVSITNTFDYNITVNDGKSFIAKRKITVK